MVDNKSNLDGAANTMDVRLCCVRLHGGHVTGQFLGLAPSEHHQNLVGVEWKHPSRAHRKTASQEESLIYRTRARVRRRVAAPPARSLFHVYFDSPNALKGQGQRLSDTHRLVCHA